MLASIISAINRHANSLLMIEIFLLVIIVVMFIGTWIYNKRKYQHLKHQIPANVVKTYLDSIIQNSSALKSSLFRGGGLDIDASGVPSVLPVDSIPGGDSVGLGSGDVSAEELNRKIAEIAQLKAQLDNKNKQISELDAKVTDLQAKLDAAYARIKELEDLLAKASTGDGEGDAILRDQLNQTIKERDQLETQLKDYAVVSDDLADLKRFKQENEMLRKALEDAGKPIPAMDEVPVAEEAKEVAPEPEEQPEVEEKVAAPEPVEEPEINEEKSEPESEEVVQEPEDKKEEEEEMAAAPPADSSGDDDDRSPEDLLSEFEKMLG